MKKLLEKLVVFTAILKVIAFFGRRRRFNGITRFLTSISAKLNIVLNKPTVGDNVSELAKSWQEMMPPDGREYFPIQEIKGNTAYTEIHLHCPLRGTGEVQACFKLMNYDRQLMDAIGGQLIVLESQSNSGKNFCRLAIRKKGESVEDFIPTHLIDKKESP